MSGGSKGWWSPIGVRSTTGWLHWPQASTSRCLRSLGGVTGRFSRRCAQDGLDESILDRAVERVLTLAELAGGAEVADPVDYDVHHGSGTGRPRGTAPYC